jgi:hypothetical protein
LSCFSLTLLVLHKKSARGENRGHFYNCHQITGLPCRSVTVPCSSSVAMLSRI